MKSAAAELLILAPVASVSGQFTPQLLILEMET
jgi:hypothetical protein